MDAKDISSIQGQIGYTFKNVGLLEQAFIRRSFSYENGGENNEVLEFIGDKVLDLIVVKILSERFGCTKEKYSGNKIPLTNRKEFTCRYTENKLTELKAELVQKQHLADCMDNLGLAGYLSMGKSDQIQHVNERPSVKEDLFEAILGAVAIDSGWNLEKLQETVELMLNPEDVLSESDGENYVRRIQAWCAEETGSVPMYRFDSGWSDGVIYSKPVLPGVYTGFDDTPTMSEFFRQETSAHRCYLKIADNIPLFPGYGNSKADARKDACKTAYKWLEKLSRLHTIRNELDNPNRNDAISQLEILARRGYFSLPTYEFELKHNAEGSPVWTAQCHIEEAEYYFESTSRSKKEAKKDAAFDMLKYVLEAF